jgi:hypothetical protein
LSPDASILKVGPTGSEMVYNDVSLTQGKITRMEAFRSEAEALDAVGLSE